MVRDQWPGRMLSAVRRGGTGKLARAVLLTIATVAGALAPAYGQSTLPKIPPPPTTIIDRGTPVTPLGWFIMGSVGCAAVSPMIATVILGRELTAMAGAIAARSKLTGVACFVSIFECLGLGLSLGLNLSCDRGRRQSIRQ